jgi:endo-chitodextinase
MKRFVAWALAVLMLALPLHAANYTDQWWNKDESGWGLTLTHHGDKLFGVWYVYDTDGKPLWVVMPDGLFSNGGRTFSGAIYRTTGPAYRDPDFLPSRVATVAIGSAKLDFAADEASATVTYTIAGVSSTKSISREPFGSAPANFPDDLTDLWWNPDESGWGLAITYHGDNIFAVWYTYGEDGRPLWVVLPGGVFSDARTFTGKLYTTTGSPYTVRFETAGTHVEEVGAATLEFSGNEGRFTSTVHGYTQVKRIVRQAFGNTASANQHPTIKLDIGGAANAIAPARITLMASASDPDGHVAKVVFYDGCERIGEAGAAPFQFVAANLAAGRYTFSARAIDDKGATTLATSGPVEVKSGTAVNKAPQVSIAAPANNAYFGLGTAVDLTATARDPDGSVAKVEYFDGAMKVGEAVQSPWTVTWSAQAGDHSFTAVATDNQGLAATSAAIAVKVAGPAPPVDMATRDAARFLTQASFGPTGVTQIEALRARGYESWLAEQFSLPAASHVQYVNDRKAAGERVAEERAYEAIWQQWLFEPGQLRARMAFALSEIFVISNVAPDLDTYAMASYMDVLNRDAFGNFRQLLEDVTLHPAMGYYLNMIGSKKADASRGTHPNENYAREVMQLFTIGLYKLNADGSRQFDAQGRPVSTYDQSAVSAMAAAFTGWNFAGNDTSKPSVFDPAKEDWLDPMVPWETWHDGGAKTLFDGITLPAAQGSRKDMKDALDALFNHPNVGPFIGRELIQRFVTSNPSPAYIGRVAATFNDNGQGARGDLQAVLRAVLMDPDARDLARAAEQTWGKQREPVIRFANYLRAFNAASPSGRNRIWYLDSADEGLNQSPLLSPSVFNFFSPNYRPPGGLFTLLGMVAPEFQITTETSMVGTLNFFARLARSGSYGSGDTQLSLDLSELNALANDPAALADRLSLLLVNGAMSEALRANLITALAAMPAAKTGSPAVTERVRAALILIAFAPEFAIQR